MLLWTDTEVTTTGDYVPYNVEMTTITINNTTNSTQLLSRIEQHVRKRWKSSYRKTKNVLKLSLYIHKSALPAHVTPQSKLYATFSVGSKKYLPIM